MSQNFSSSGAAAANLEIRSEFRRDLLIGLRKRPRALPSKYFYDAEGAALFDRICDLEVYYPTRAETEIMQRHAAAMTALMGPQCMLVEYGSGSSIKTQQLLDHLRDPTAYVPIDISAAYLEQSTRRLSERYPELRILPVVADYTGDFELPEPPKRSRRIIVYFPGSTIGNFDRSEALDFLLHVREVTAPDGGLLIGVDLKKDAATLEAAYDDPEGVTAAFNRNILARANRELDSNFDLDAFDHKAVYNATEGRIEMYLISRVEQRVRVDGQDFSFLPGEAILTEYSHKYSIEEFGALGREAGFAPARTWTDDDRLFSVHYLVPNAAPGNGPPHG